MLTDHKITTYAANIKNLSNTPSSDGVTASALKALFDGRTDAEVKASINGIIDTLVSSAGAGDVGAAVTGIAATHVQGILEALKVLIDDRYSKTASDARYASQTDFDLLEAEVDLKIEDDDLNGLVKSVTFDSATGTFTITKYDDTTATINTNIEKIPASMALETVGGVVYLVITNDDGTTTSADVSNLMNSYTFNDTDTIDFSASTVGTSTTVTADVKDGSITEAKLSADAKTYVQTTAQSEFIGETQKPPQELPVEADIELLDSFSGHTISITSNTAEWDFTLGEKAYIANVSGDVGIAVYNLYDGAIGVLQCVNSSLVLSDTVDAEENIIYRHKKSADFDYVTAGANQYYLYSFYFREAEPTIDDPLLSGTFYWTRSVFDV